MAGLFDDVLTPPSQSSGLFDDIIPKPKAPTQADPVAGIKKPASAVRRVVGDTAVRALQGVVGAGESAVGLLDIPTGGYAGKALDAVGYRPAQAKEAIGELYSDEQKAANQAVEDAEGFVGTAKTMLENPSTIAGAVVESIPLMLGGGAIAKGLASKIVSPVARAAIGEGAVGAGAAAESLRQGNDDGLLTAKDTVAALGAGVGTGLLGAAGGKIAQKLDIADVDTALAGGGTVADDIARPGIVRRVLGGAIGEGVLEEAPQSAQEQVWQNFANDRPLGEGVPEATAAGMLTGAAIGGPFAGIAKPQVSPVGDTGGGDTGDPGADVPNSGTAPPNAGTPQHTPLAAAIHSALRPAPGSVADVASTILSTNPAPGPLARTVIAAVGVDPIAAAAPPETQGVATGQTNPLTGQPVQADPAQIVEYLITQAQANTTMPGVSAIAKAYGIDPKDARALRQEAQGLIKERAKAQEGSDGQAAADAVDAGGPLRPGQAGADPAEPAGGVQAAAAQQDQDRGDYPDAQADAGQDSGDRDATVGAVAGPAAGTQEEGLTYDESDELQDDDITAPSGGAYENRGAAENAAKRHEGGKVYQVEGGFVVRVPKAAPVASSDQPEAAQSAPASQQPAEPSIPASEPAASAASQPSVSPEIQGQPSATPAVASPNDAPPPADAQPGNEVAKKRAPLNVRMGGQEFPVESFEDASRKFQELKGTAGDIGGMRVVELIDESGKGVGYIGQNGEVYEGDFQTVRFRPGSKAPVYVPPAVIDGEASRVGTTALSAPADASGDAPAASAPGAAAPGVVPEVAPASSPATSAQDVPATSEATSGAPPDLTTADSAGQVGADGVSAIQAAAETAATSDANDLPQPTQAQKEAGNYQKGHVVVGGHDISIENPAGSRRKPEWPPLKHHYGYIKGTVGKDKDHLDVFLTERAADTSLPVFVIDQNNKDGSFDEHKIILGTPNEPAARKAYLSNYAPGWNGLGAVTQMTQEQFKTWSLDAVATKKPAAGKPATPEIVTVHDVYGDTHRVRKADLDAGGERLINTYTAKGELKKPRGLHPGNIAKDEAAIAAVSKGARWITRRGARSDADQGWANEAGVVREIKRMALDPTDFEIRRTPGGYVGVRKAQVAATHADPGETPEAVTQEVITESLQKAADRTPLDIKAAKEKLLADVEAAIAASKDLAGHGVVLLGGRFGAIDQSDRRSHDTILDAIGYVTFDVPGDGKFTVLNVRERLTAFRAQVEKSPGFRPPAKRSPMAKAPPANAVGTAVAMWEDGEYAAALELLDVAGFKTTLATSHKAPYVRAFYEVEDVELPFGITGQVGRMLSKGRPWQIVIAGKYGGSAPSADAAVKEAAVSIRKEGEASFREKIADATSQAVLRSALLSQDKADPQLASVEAAAHIAAQQIPPLQRQLEPLKKAHAEFDIAALEQQWREMGPGMEVGIPHHRKRALDEQAKLGERIANLEKEIAALQRVVDEGGAPTSPNADPRDLPLPLPVSKDETVEATESLAGKIGDLGEKIGGARKDLSGGRKEKVAEPPRYVVAASRTPGAWILRDGKTDKQVAAEGRFTSETAAQARADALNAARAEAQASDSTWRKRYAVVSNETGEIGRKPWRVVDLRTGRAMRGAEADTQAEAESMIPLLVVSLNHRARPQDGDRWGIWRDVTDRKRVKVVKQAFDSRDEAMRYMAQHAVEIIETKTRYGEDVLAKPDTVNRKGPARRAQDVAGDDFLHAFGFRGVEFGNWNNQAERQEVMNHAFDGLHDLAEVLGIPPKAISLNGDLALAFGARGQGLTGARAHYEPGKGVINLTKMQGAGALAHEWFHALDHYFGRLDGKAPTGSKASDGTTSFATKTANTTSAFMLSHGNLRDSKMRAELLQNYRDLIQSMFTKAETYVEDTQQAAKFVERTQEALAKSLQSIRNHLAKERQYGAKKKPATPEQLAQFDALAAKIMGTPQVFGFKPSDKKGVRGFASFGGRNTNDTLEAMSVILKAVTGRSGFSAEKTGALDEVRGHARRHAERLAMLASAQKQDTKSKRVPTSFAMEAKKIDQGAVTDYWTTPHEMAARAFSAYVEDKISARAGSSDFLSFGSDNSLPEYRLLGIRPFPEGAERAALDEAFDSFFETLQTRETDDGNVAMFKQSPSTDGMKVPVVQAVVDRLRAGNASVLIVSDYSQLPEQVRKQAGQLGAKQSEVKGVHWRGTSYLVAANIADAAEAQRVLFHEAFVHGGLRARYGNKIESRLVTLAGKLAGTGRPGERVLALAEKQGIKLGGYIRGLNADASKTETQKLAILTEELLAHMGETTGTLRAYLEEVLGLIREFLRHHGFAELSALTAADLRLEIRRARQALQEGSTVQALNVAAFSRAEQTDSKAFKAWFRKSQVVNADGSPKPVYHGTASEFWTFDKGQLASSTGHMTAPLGFFFAEDQAKAQRYAEKASEGVPADERVIDVYLSIQNAKPMTLAAFMEVDSQDEARALRTTLLKQGFDGIHIAEIGQWIAFEPNQAKSASENTGAFNLANDDIRFSLAPRDGEGDAYRDALTRLMTDRRTLVQPITVMRVPAALARVQNPHLNVPSEIDVMVNRDVIRKATNGVKHAVPMVVIEQLPELLADPVAIFAAKQMEGGYNVVLRAEEAGQPVMVAVHMRATWRGMQIARIASVYGRPLGQYQQWANDGLLRYVSEKTNPDGTTLMGLRLPASRSPGRGSGPTLGTKDDPVKGHEPLPEGDDDVRFSLRAPADVLDDIEAVMAAGQGKDLLQRAKDALASLVPAKLKDQYRPTWLAALTTRHLTELGADYFSGIEGYSEILARMGADRNQLQQDGEDVAERMRQWAAKNPQEARRMFKLAHDATISGADPAEDYEPLQFRFSGKLHVVTNKSIREAITAIKQQIRERSGDNKQDMLNEIKRLQAMKNAEPKRKASHPGMVERWNKLSPEAKAFYIEMRKKYVERSKMVEAGLIARINDTDAAENHKRKLINVIRHQFETQRLQGVYFPLQRHGRYFVAADKGDTSTFLMFETLSQLDRAVKDLKDRGFEIKARGMKEDGRAKDAPSGTFVADVISKLKAAHISEAMQDDIYQLYLQALPEMSMRKHAIHRQSVPGFDPDAVRAFAFNMHHGAHQIARLRHAHHLADTLAALKRGQDASRKDEQADTRKIAAGDAILAELGLRHQWIMDPQDSAVTAKVSSFGFVYYLGLTPAAALVNLTQTALISFPYLAARYGPVRAMNQLLKGMGGSIATVGHLQKKLTDPDELRAHADLQLRGALDKTQAHNLAGIAEGGMTGYNPALAKAMQIVAWGFHKTEVMNREATGIAAYRLARADGATHEAAVNEAARAINDTHYDYTNQNRARVMQSGTAKVLLMFKQYSLNTTWHLGRMVWQATKGQSPEVKKIARRNLAGVLGMTSLFAGTLGLPMMSVTFGVLNAIAASFGDDDEPWDAETEFRAFLADMLGAGAGEVIATGAVNKLTGADVSSRVSMSQLWFRDADRELDGRGAYWNMLEQAAGPMGGVLKNALVGKQMIDEGRVMRGVETMLPKALKDTLKAQRYAAEGVNNMRGDPLVKDLSLHETLLQLTGFTPAEVADQYDTNRSLKNYEQHILDRRRFLMDAFAMALRTDDDDGRVEVLEKIRAFNQANPEIQITPKGLRSSIGQRARYTANAENGITLNKKLAAKVRDAVGAD